MGELVAGNNELCKRISEALGIKHGRFLQLTMSVGSLVSVKAEFCPEGEQLEKLIPILEEYNLVKKEKEKEDNNEAN